jgi:hypothetical protein
VHVHWRVFKLPMPQDRRAGRMHRVTSILRDLHMTKIHTSKISPTTQILRTLRRQIGHDIHTARLAKRMTLAKLSRLTHIPVWQLDQFELGKGEIGLEELVRVWWVLKIEYYDFKVLIITIKGKNHV